MHHHRLPDSVTECDAKHDQTREPWPEYMSPPKAALYLDSSTSTLAKLRLRGGGPRYCRIGRAIRYRRNDLDVWLSSFGRRSTSDVGDA
jgi:hypothetical protein